MADSFFLLLLSPLRACLIHHPSGIPGPRGLTFPMRGFPSIGLRSSGVGLGSLTSPEGYVVPYSRGFGDDLHCHPVPVCRSRFPESFGAPGSRST